MKITVRFSGAFCWLALLTLQLTCPSPAGAVLTNGLVAYWPLDYENGTVLTPDLAGGRDLKVYQGGGNTLSNFNANTVTFVPGVRSNAASFVKARAAQLGYISADAADIMPPVRMTNWTLSFWIKTDPTLHAAGDRVLSMCHNTGPNTLWDLAYEDGSISTPATIDHFLRQSQAAPDYADLNGSGAHFKGDTNAIAFDNSWHNITIVSKLVTNLTPPVIADSSYDRDTATATVQWTSDALDSLAANYPFQVVTNQNYIVERADLVSGPWTEIATVGSGGGPGTIQIYTDTSATNPVAFYRVRKPGVRHIDQALYVDRTNRCLWNNNYLENLLPGVPVRTAAQYRQNGRFNATTFGVAGLFRANGTSARWTTCLVDDMAIWNRALSDSEIQEFITTGVTVNNPPPPTAVLSAAFPTVVTNDTDLLSWTATAPPATLALFPGNINVTPQSVFGVGSSNVTVIAPTLYQLVATKTLTATGSVFINVVSNVVANWHYIDSFTFINPGNIGSQGDWLNPLAAPATQNLQPLQVHTASGGNKLVAFNGFNTPDLPNAAGGGGVAGRPLKTYTCNLGQSNTIFFRFYIDHSITNIDSVSGLTPAIDMRIGISDKGILDPAFLNGGNGPEIRILSLGGVGGYPLPIELSCQNGPAALDLVPQFYNYSTDEVNGDTNGLALDKVYSVWIDFQNRDSGVTGGLGSGGVQTNADLYTVWLQREDWPSRTNLFSNIVSTNNVGDLNFGQGVLASGRDMSTFDVAFPQTEPLKTVYIQMATGITPQGTNTVRFDDFYISKVGTNSTVPLAAGSFAVP